MRSERAVLQDISRNVKVRRDALGISQVVLAERVGVGAHTIRRVEAADGSVAIGTIIAAASYFGVDLNDLCAPAGSKVAAQLAEPQLNRGEVATLAGIVRRYKRRPRKLSRRKKP